MKLCELFENALTSYPSEDQNWFYWISKVERLLKRDDGITLLELGGIFYPMSPIPKDDLYDNLYNNFYLKHKGTHETVEYLLTALHNRFKYKNGIKENTNIIDAEVPSSLDGQKKIPNVLDKEAYKHKKFFLKRKKSVYGLDPLSGTDSASGATDGSASSGV